MRSHSQQVKHFYPVIRIPFTLAALKRQGHLIVMGNLSPGDRSIYRGSVRLRIVRQRVPDGNSTSPAGFFFHFAHNGVAVFRLFSQGKRDLKHAVGKAVRFVGGDGYSSLMSYPETKHSIASFQMKRARR